MVKFIVTDLDGTLLNSKKQMPNELGEVIQHLQEKGIIFVPASGRQYFNLLKQFSMMSGEFMYIAENGAMVVKDGKTIVLDCIASEEAKKIVVAVRNIPTASALVCCDDYAFAEDESKQEFVYSAVTYYDHYKHVDNLLGYCDDKNICKVAVFDEINAEDNVYHQLKQVSKANVILSGNQWVDVMKPGVNKGSAISHIQKLFHLKKEECMAFGDYLNDVEMMDMCGYSYAMENAHPDLKAHARFIAPSNDDNGVIITIKQFLNL